MLFICFAIVRYCAQVQTPLHYQSDLPIAEHAPQSENTCPDGRQLPSVRLLFSAKIGYFTLNDFLLFSLYIPAMFFLFSFFFPSLLGVDVIRPVRRSLGAYGRLLQCRLLCLLLLGVLLRWCLGMLRRRIILDERWAPPERVNLDG